MKLCLLINLAVSIASAPAIDEDRSQPNPVLEQFWRDSLKRINDEETYAELLDSIGLMGKEASQAIPALLDDLKSDVVYRRKLACKALAVIGRSKEPVIAAIIELSGDAEFRVQYEAEAALVKFDQLAAPLLEKAMADANGSTRIRYAELLFRVTHHPEKSLPVLIAGLKDADSGVRYQAAGVLGMMGRAAAPAVKALATRLDDPDPYYRMDAALHLWSVERNSERVIPIVKSVLEDREFTAQTSVALALLERMGTQAHELAPLIVKLCSDPDENKRISAVNYLCLVCSDPKIYLPVLRTCLSDTNPLVRGNCAIALAKAGAVARGEAPLIRKLLKDDNPLTRVQAAMALWRLDADVDRTLPVLIAGLDSADRMAVINSLNALGEIGPPAKPAVPVLLERLKNSRLRPSYVKETINLIDPEALRLHGGR
jgi:HEAT repeat protein